MKNARVQREHGVIAPCKRKRWYDRRLEGHAEPVLLVANGRERARTHTHNECCASYACIITALGGSLAVHYQRERMRVKVVLRFTNNDLRAAVK